MSATTTTRRKSAEASISAAPEVINLVERDDQGQITTPLAGEVVAFKGISGKHRFPDVVAALKAAGLDDSVARTMLPRHAFTRACKDLSENRDIRLVDEGKDTLVFQFTRVQFDDSSKEFQFSTEAKLCLNKTTGAVDCPANPSLATHAAKLIQEEMGTRHRGDVTDMVRRLFEANADLICIPDNGGAYFVPVRFTAFIEQVDTFLRALGGHVERLPIPRGTKQGDATIQRVVTSHLEGLVDTFLREAKELSEKESARESTWKRMLDRIQESRFKAMGYQEYLTEKLGEVTAKIDQANAEVRRKLEIWLDAKNSPVTAACDHCHAVVACPSEGDSFVCPACGQTNTLEW